MMETEKQGCIYKSKDSVCRIWLQNGCAHQHTQNLNKPSFYSANTPCASPLPVLLPRFNRTRAAGVNSPHSAQCTMTTVCRLFPTVAVAYPHPHSQHSSVLPLTPIHHSLSFFYHLQLLPQPQSDA